MDREAQLAYEAEKVLADVMEVSLSKGWKQNFRKAMAETISERLEEMKQEEDPVSEADAQAVAIAKANIDFGKNHRCGRSHGAGAQSGAAVGSTTSLNRQAGAAGRGGRALAGY